MADEQAQAADKALRAVIARQDQDEDAALDTAFLRWLIAEATPEDWHRFALGANWDSVEPAVFAWIATRPTCDAATALLLFWQAQPAFELEYRNDAAQAETTPLVRLIRERWSAGAYTQSDFAFFLKDLFPPDLDDLDRRFPRHAAELMPMGMRVNLLGRAIDTAGTLDGMPRRFWPPGIFDDNMDAPQLDQFGRLNHVGIATPSIERAIESYHVMLGANAIGTPFDLPAQGVRVCFIDAPNTQIELIEPLGDASPIAAFLRKNPVGGQHHLCFEVPDIHLAIAILEVKGATILGEPRIGAHGTPIVFIHPRDMGGVLIELMESPAGDH